MSVRRAFHVRVPSRQAFILALIPFLVLAGAAQRVAGVNSESESVCRTFAWG